MVRPVRILALILALLAAGCDTVNLQQYRLADATQTDASDVKRVLGVVAAQTGLEDRTTSSMVPHTLVFYKEPDVQHFAVNLGARRVGEDIIVDLIAGFGPMRNEFRKTRALLTPALSNEFGPRLIIARLGTNQFPISFK
jgi:hypothetical protein